MHRRPHPPCRVGSLPAEAPTRRTAPIPGRRHTGRGTGTHVPTGDNCASGGTEAPTRNYNTIAGRGMDQDERRTLGTDRAPVSKTPHLPPLQHPKPPPPPPRERPGIRRASHLRETPCARPTTKSTKSIGPQPGYVTKRCHHPPHRPLPSACSIRPTTPLPTAIVEPMNKFNLTDVAAHELSLAAESPAGRSTDTVIGGSRRRLRQSVMTLIAGERLAEHEFPGESTLQILSGSVRLDTGDDSMTGDPGDLLVIPPERHSLTAVTDTAMLLTVVK